MKINWKVRMQNRVWLMTFIAAALALVYEVLAVFGIAPKVEQAQLMHLAEMLVGVLVLLGVVVDPTTPGTSDSDRAMTYGKASQAPSDGLDMAAISAGLKGAEIIEEVEEDGEARADRKHGDQVQ